MAMKDIKNKFQGWMQKVTESRESGQKPPMSTMPNGSVSGYQPRINRSRPAVETQDEHPASSFGRMAPAGVDPTGFQQFGQPVQPQQQTQQATGYQPPVQPYGNQAGSRPMPPPQGAQPQGYGQMFGGTGYQPPVQGTQPPVGAQPQYGQPSFGGTGYQPRHQQPMQQQTSWQPPVQQTPPQGGQNVQQHTDGNVRYFPGTVRDEEGNAYSMVLRVAQITGITSCYRLLEFMQYGEAVIVNAEQITDTLEADRCMDMLFGAAYAMNQTFGRIAGRMIYLIAPRHVHVLPFDSIQRMSQQDKEGRWPGSSRPGVQENRFNAFRQDDFAPAFGQRAAAPQPAYSEFGGFSGFGGGRR